jgi:glutamate racemase
MTPVDLSSSSIGIFDSGFGGLTVMKAIRASLPHENIIYFGDTAHLPYGNKSPETIRRYAQESVAFLKELGIKILVVACHTACSAAFDILRESFDIPIIGILEQGVEAIAETSSAGHIAVLGTKTTISSGVYQQLLQQKLPTAQVSPISCPLFVSLVEEGYVDHLLTTLAVREYLSPIKRSPIDTVLLGCTHFPLLHSIIQRELGPQVKIIDPAERCAHRTQELLNELHLLNTSRQSPQYQFYVSDDPEKFRLHGRSFLDYPIEAVLLRDCL